LVFWRSECSGSPDELIDFCDKLNYYTSTLMLRKLLLIASALIFSLGILFTSILRTASVKYEFQEERGNYLDNKVLGANDIEVDYQLAYPGKILPDHPLWPVKALRDRLWLMLTTNSSRRAELKLLFADKRIGSALLLFEKGNFEDGFSTLTKAEKYLEEAYALEEQVRSKGADTTELLKRLALASLKHYDLMQDIYFHAPEDARPKIIETYRYSKKVYEDSRNALLQEGEMAPENPFEWQ